MELELAQKILKRFEINDTVISINQNKTGLINQTFEIFTTKNKYILQENKYQNFSKLPTRFRKYHFNKKMAKKTNYSYEFPSPLQNQYLNFDNKLWRLLPFVKNSKSINKVSKIKEVEEAVKCMS